jgi:hypothetical protein
MVISHHRQTKNQGLAAHEQRRRIFSAQRHTSRAEVTICAHDEPLFIIRSAVRPTRKGILTALFEIQNKPDDAYRLIALRVDF